MGDEGRRKRGVKDQEKGTEFQMEGWIDGGFYSRAWIECQKVPREQLKFKINTEQTHFTRSPTKRFECSRERKKDSYSSKGRFEARLKLKLKLEYRKRK